MSQFTYYKSEFRNEIEGADWFAARFLFAIDRKFQRWLGECKRDNMSRADVNDKLLDFSNDVNDILNGQFRMRLPPSFQKGPAAAEKRASDQPAAAEATKRKKGDKGAANDGKVTVKNSNQHEAFKLRQGENWSKTFKNAHVSDRPGWNGTTTQKMCVRWHILGDCYEDCSRKESHVPQCAIPAEKVDEMKSFMAKCRGE